MLGVVDMEEKEEVVSSKTIQQNSETLEFHIDNYENKEELYSAAFELFKRSLFMILLIFMTLICGFYMVLCLISIILSLILGKIEIRFFLFFFISAIFVIPLWKDVKYIHVTYLQKSTKNLLIKINGEKIILSSDNRYNEIEIKKIKVKEKKNGIILIFKRVNDKRKSKKLNLMKKIISWYDCIPLLESNFTKEEIKVVKHLMNQNKTKTL